MSENMEKNDLIVSKADLGEGRKQVTFKVDPSDLTKYFGDKGIDYKLGDDFQIGKGSVKSRYQPTTSDYLSQYYTSDTKSYTQALKTPVDPHEKIRLAVELYHKEPIIGTVIDMMVDFSASGFNNECEDREVKELFDKWGKSIKLQEIIEQIFLEYYRSGNVSIYRNTKDAVVRKTTKTNSGKEDSKEFKFPSGYTILNPMNVKIEGPLMFNQEMAYLQLNEDLIELVGKGDSNVSKMIPNEVKKAVLGGKGMIALDPKLHSRITRKKQPYERYATPFLERVFESILYKQKLRMMDMSTIEGLVNQLVTVTVGNDEYPATDEDLEAIAELFQTPNKAYTIFWNHTLEVTFHKPEGIETLNHEKYQQVNDDILSGLGVSRVLIDGQGANFSTAWVSILSLIERLDNTRDKVKDWLEAEYKRIADENGFKTAPKVVFNKMNLREDNYIRDVLLSMYDRGLIDEEDLLKETGRDYESIIETKKKNQKNKKLFYPPEQPFQGGNTSPNNGKESKPNPNGYKKRETSPEQNSGNAPKAKANRAIAYSAQLEEEYENELEESYLDIKNAIADMLSDKDRDDNTALDAFLTGAVLALFSSMNSIGRQYIDKSYEYEFTKHSNELDQLSQAKKKELVNWNNSYINKLAFDIKDAIIANISKGLSINLAVNKAFTSNAYRISSMSEAVILDSTRQAKIEGNRTLGSVQARWISRNDENTCGTCRGLHGNVFNIDEIPPRPHVHCRCDLDFI